MVLELGPTVELQAGDTVTNVSIHEEDAGRLILAQTLPRHPQYTP